MIPLKQFQKKFIIVFLLATIPFFTLCQVKSGSGSLLKSGLGYYIDNNGKVINGKIQLYCGSISGPLSVKNPRLKIKVGNSKKEVVEINQFTKVVIEADTFIRVIADSVAAQITNSIPFEYDLYYQEISGEIQSSFSYFCAGGDRIKIRFINYKNEGFKRFRRSYFATKLDLKEYILNFIKDKPTVYNKWETQNLSKLIRLFDEILIEYNTTEF